MRPPLIRAQAARPKARFPAALDDTLARKRGRQIHGAGTHHDPLLSTRQVAPANWGHRADLPREPGAARV